MNSKFVLEEKGIYLWKKVKNKTSFRRNKKKTFCEKEKMK